MNDTNRLSRYAELMCENLFVRRALWLVFDEKNQLRFGYHDYSHIFGSGISVSFFRSKLENEKVIVDCTYDFIKNVKDSKPRQIDNSQQYAQSVSMVAQNAEWIIGWIVFALVGKKNISELVQHILDKLFPQKINKYLFNERYSIVARENIIFYPINSVGQYIESIATPGKLNLTFSRGHSNINYQLIPSVFRTEELRECEDALYHQLTNLCPEQFIKCSTFLEKLVIMQHFGLYTRLLDITRNPLVSLYFACSANKEKNGEVIFFDREYTDTDNYSVEDAMLLSSFADLSYADKYVLMNGNNKGQTYINALSALEHTLSQNGVLCSASSKDVAERCRKSLFVQVPYNNPRISRQNGAFIICSDNAVEGELYSYRQYWYKDENSIAYIVPKENKESIMSELDGLSINQANLFPDIENIAKYLQNNLSEIKKYKNKVAEEVIFKQLRLAALEMNEFGKQ